MERSKPKKLILGTVQFGIPYGINNPSKALIPEQKVFDSLELAAKEGVQILDSAEAYGEALDRIRRFHQSHSPGFEVISKFSSIKQGETLKSKVEKNLEKTDLSWLYAYMFHNFDHYRENPDFLEELRELKSEGLIQYGGVSVYQNEELEALLDDPVIDLIQLPFNLLDNFGRKGGLLKKAKAKGKIIHVRSVFLQGLFFKSFEEFPDQLQPLIPYLKQLSNLSAESGLSLNQLALNYPFSFAEIDGVLLGVDHTAQLSENIVSLRDVDLEPFLLNEINKIQVEETNLLNPANWS